MFRTYRINSRFPTILRGFLDSHAVCQVFAAAGARQDSIKRQKSQATCPKVGHAVEFAHHFFSRNWRKCATSKKYWGAEDGVPSGSVRCRNIGSRDSPFQPCAWVSLMVSESGCPRPCFGVTFISINQDFAALTRFILNCDFFQDD